MHFVHARTGLVSTMRRPRLWNIHISPVIRIFGFFSCGFASIIAFKGTLKALESLYNVSPCLTMCVKKHYREKA